MEGNLEEKQGRKDSWVRVDGGVGSVVMSQSRRIVYGRRWNARSAGWVSGYLSVY